MYPNPPYYAVIFSSIRTTEADDLYASTAEDIFSLAAKQPGYLGHDTARDSTRHGITVTYWDSVENIKRWKTHAEHLVVQKMGTDMFYEEYHVRVAKIEREYRWSKPNSRETDKTN
jgi:heme-degrading monooxygenase HmoA